MARPNRDTRMRFGLDFPRSVNTRFGQSADLAREGMKGGMEWLLCAGSIISIGRCYRPPPESLGGVFTSGSILRPFAHRRWSTSSVTCCVICPASCWGLGRATGTSVATGQRIYPRAARSARDRVVAGLRPRTQSGRVHLGGYLKHYQLHNFCPHDFTELSYHARQALKRRRRRPALVIAFSEQAGLFLL
jgi:hypothetical protein